MYNFEILDNVTDNILEIHTDYKGMLTLAHPLLQSIKSEILARGYTIDTQHKFTPNSVLYFNVITTPEGYRKFYFRYTNRGTVDTEFAKAIGRA